ncbi:sulfatase-like protein [Arcicella aurantiaca]|uniref:Sulfatase-like protein n=1 Tax=Arcicella aurantiaca TaxID=591202 RepID=A0A316DTG8_9BACT|nr:sulfatase-like hydrolase/transferase [Arcicella aurantiaca]PWK21607.1 sulfatase-like protein [Arcicella aurantiaca]
MKKRLLLSAVSLCLFALCFVSFKKIEQEPQKLNILWITNEDMSPQHLGCYGGKVAKTPNIDLLAKQGVRYTNGELSEKYLRAK